MFPASFHLGRQSRDLFECVDAIACPFLPPYRTIGIQFTSRTNVAARVRKVQESKALGMMERMGWRVVVWGFDHFGSELRCRESVVLG